MRLGNAAELRPVALSFGLLFLIVTAHTISETARDALAVTWLEARSLGVLCPSITAAMLPGPYRIRDYTCRVRAVLTCKAPASQSSPVFGDGLLFVDAGRHGQKGAAVDPTGTGDVSKTHVKWEARVETAAGSSAIIVASHVYRAGGQDFIRCWSIKDGELVREVKAPRVTPSASPIVDRCRGW